MLAKKILQCALCAFCLTLASASGARAADSGNAHWMTPSQAREYIPITPDLYLLDVRPSEDFAKGHLNGAVNIPLGELKGRLHEIPAEKPVLVYCQTGSRATKATEQILSDRPGQDVRAVTGNILGHPVAQPGTGQQGTEQPTTAQPPIQ